MKIQKNVSLDNGKQTQQFKKAGLKLQQKNFLGSIKLKYGNLQKDTISFGSPVIDKSVIWKNATSDLIDKIARFIDKFEDYGKSNVRNGYNYSTNINADTYSATYLGGGVSGDAYKVSVDGDSKYVIKEPKSKRCSDTVWRPSGITHEFQMLDMFKDDSRFQQGISLMKTQNGNYYMVSKFEEGNPAGANKYDFNVLTHEGVKDTLNILEGMDKVDVFNSDWNIGNIFYKGDNYYPKMLDLQWAYPKYTARDYFHFVPGETETNMASYEMGTIGSYMTHLYDKTGSKNQTRDFLRMYLKERANHCDTLNRFEEIRKNVYQNPTEDVLDAEILRLSILKNHIHQFLYTDKNNEEPRDMLKMIRYQAYANFSAKQLSEFQPQRPYSETSYAEDKYFEKMRDFGKDWHSITKDWYSGSMNWMKKLVSGDDYQTTLSGYFYFPEKFGKNLNDSQNFYVMDNTKLTSVLSDGARRDYIKNEDKYNLKSNIKGLENTFINLKNAASNNSYYEVGNLKTKVSSLISDVLV